VLIILGLGAGSKKIQTISEKYPLKICWIAANRLKLAASSFCVYLFGLESLAAIG
jgi:hypothetical protein